MLKIKLLINLFILLIATNLSSQGIWMAAGTNPVTGRDVNGAWAVSQTVCWMCGASVSGTMGYVILTTNGGTSWTNVTGNMPSSGFGLYSICGISATEAWAGASDGGLYHTTNTGANWIFITLPNPTTPFIDDIHFFNQSTGFVIGDPVSGYWGYYWTTNAGANWTFGPSPAGTGTETGWNNSHCALDTGHIWFGTNSSKIYKGGFRSGFSSIPISGVYSFGITFFNANTGLIAMANSAQSVLAFNRTTNGGLNWTAGFLPAAIQYGLKAIPGTPYAWSCGAGLSGGQIYFSSNYGVNWTSQFLCPNAIYAFSFANQFYGWAGASGGAIYKWIGYIDEVNSNNNSIPNEYKLEQNYPNPFNPVTTIEFYLPKESKVTLKVFDLLGREVATLINNEEKKSGGNSFLFDASNLSSGIYYYKLFANEFVETRKMIQLK